MSVPPRRGSRPRWRGFGRGDQRNTARAYGTALRALVAEVGAATSVAVLDEESTVERIGLWFVGRWGACAAATVNARLDALRSAADWWRAQGWLVGDPRSVGGRAARAAPER
ncbi:hypothetical protein [Actinopolyspora mortivallis]|uniref:hypothetical protein n=1 Tax=Actinopolyspora mortivallis TaxID=33906 RepID=UPI001FE10939|nr:hypothetical protein [Actinopolyspora mortivallis]